MCHLTVTLIVNLSVKMMELQWFSSCSPDHWSFIRNRHVQHGGSDVYFFSYRKVFWTSWIIPTETAYEATQSQPVQQKENLPLSSRHILRRFYATPGQSAGWCLKTDSSSSASDRNSFPYSHVLTWFLSLPTLCLPSFVCGQFKKNLLLLSAFEVHLELHDIWSKEILLRVFRSSSATTALCETHSVLTFLF